ncbi:MAG TPA: NAD(P)/FAD-dependent oxidoreductase [Planctomycetota bacterium]|nr:NAD(P)/FAD-dependent oxidoreductase [Planctomycetota bacterium]
MRDDTDVIIVGGGIAGLGLACALAAWDVRVLVLEKRREPGGIHRGDSLLPKTTGLFARWGVLDAIRAAGAEAIDHIEVHSGRSKICEAPLVLPGARDPYLVLPHARIEQVLAEQAVASGRTTLRRQTRVTDLIIEEDRVRGVRFETSSGPEEARAPLVVACDGHRSTARSRLGIGIEPFFYDHAYLGLEADRPASYRNAMRVHFHAEGGVLLMPRPTRIGIGMLVSAESRERWVTMSDAELRQELEARAPILSEVAIHREGAHVYELARAHAERYVAKGAVIIGDAAHCTNPTAGQGMTTALGDAGALADVVGPALERGHRELGAILAGYEAARWPLNEKLVRGSHRLARVYALRGRGWNGLKLGAARALASPLGRFVVEPVMKLFLEDRPPTPALPPLRAGRVEVSA